MVTKQKKYVKNWSTLSEIQILKTKGLIKFLVTNFIFFAFYVLLTISTKKKFHATINIFHISFWWKFLSCDIFSKKLFRFTIRNKVQNLFYFNVLTEKEIYLFTGIKIVFKKFFWDRKMKVKNSTSFKKCSL